jgi:diketogulonate reductase-like aldo/keto reductase
MVDTSGMLDLKGQGPIKLPTPIGLGTFKSKNKDVQVAVRCALQHGIRHIDTASIYKVGDDQ